jgi:hypothetical protein
MSRVIFQFFNRNKKNNLFNENTPEKGIFQNLGGSRGKGPLPPNWPTA